MPANFNYPLLENAFSNDDISKAMQVLKSTARWVNKDQVSKEILLNDVKYNIMTSMKYLRMLHNQYKNWKIVFGYYNTGYPRVNGYAERVYNHKIDWR